MSADDWKDLQADIRNSLTFDPKNGETMIDVVTRIVWLERHKNQIRIRTLNEILRGVNGDPLPARRAPVKNSRHGRMPQIRQLGAGNAAAASWQAELGAGRWTSDKR
jgi:hypothetical protein